MAYQVAAYVVAVILVSPIVAALHLRLDRRRMKYVGTLPASMGKVPIANRLIVHKLKATPGEWWEIRDYPLEKAKNAYVYVHNCRRGAIKSLSPALGIEVKAQAREDGSVAVYARYVEPA